MGIPSFFMKALTFFIRQMSGRSDASSASIVQRIDRFEKGFEHKSNIFLAENLQELALCVKKIPLCIVIWMKAHDQRRPPWLTNAERMLILMKKSRLIPLLVILLLCLCALRNLYLRTGLDTCFDSVSYGFPHITVYVRASSLGGAVCF
jgi:hypothetical protein